MSCTKLPFVSLDAVTSSGIGESKDLEGVFSRHTVIVTTTGDPSSANVGIHISHDGINWVGTPGAANASSGPAVHTIDGYLARFVRASCDLSGGTSPTLTATIASLE